MNQNAEDLRAWVDRIWPNMSLNDFVLKPEFHAQDEVAPQWQALHGDAGFRRYFRLASEPALLAVYAPPESEDIQAFLKIGQLLRTGGVLTPAVAACDEEKGYLLIQDFGPHLLLDQLQIDGPDALYPSALKTLLQIQCCADRSGVLQTYSQQKLRSEMALFEQWFVEAMLGQSFSIAEKKHLEACFNDLEASALAQPQVLVHRDYHSRNLVYRGADALGVIDFQDAVTGPLTYDLVSLLRDCYIRWPEDDVKRWALMYFKQAKKLELCPAMSEQEFLRWFDWMGLQRHIKVLGIFARLSIRDNKQGYLADLPRVLHYVKTVAERYRETQFLVSLLNGRLAPFIKAQAWYDEVD